MEGALVFTIDDLKIGRRNWTKTAGIPPRKLGLQLEDCTKIPEKVREGVTRWMKAVTDGRIIRDHGGEHCGRGMLLYGTPGIGKTSVALGVIQDFIKSLPLQVFAPTNGNVIVRPCYFTTYSGLLSLNSDLMDDEHLESSQVLYDGILGEAADDAYNVRVLIIDDVGKEHMTVSGWQKNMLHHILRTRFDNGLPTIITTNIPREDWANIYGDATGSFVKESCVYIPFESTKDLR